MPVGLLDAVLGVRAWQQMRQLQSRADQYLAAPETPAAPRLVPAIDWNR